MANRFSEEVKSEIGYIVNSDGKLVGTWLWKNGNMTVSTKNRYLQETLSQGLLSRGAQFDSGEVTFDYSTASVRLSKFSPVELSSILSPDFTCITDKERVQGEVELLSNEGSSKAVYKRVFRGYVLERLRGRDITIGVWFYTPHGIVCQTRSRAFDRTFQSIKNKLTRVELTPKGVKEVPLKFEEATYFDITLKLPERYYLVPSWGIEIPREKYLEVGV